MADKDDLALPPHYAPEADLNHHPLTATRHQHDTLLAEIIKPLSTIQSLHDEIETAAYSLPLALANQQSNHNGLHSLTELFSSARRVIEQQEAELNT